MSGDGKSKLPQSSATSETTPLLSKKEVPPGKLGSGPDSTAAGTSKTFETNKAGLSGALTESDASKKLQDNAKEEVADHISSYEGMADVVTPSFGCGLFYGIWLCTCYCLSSFKIQFPLHLLLLCFPVAIGFMGAKYMTQCPMNVNLPYATMVVGFFGTLVLLVRLAWLLHAKFSSDERLLNWMKKGTMFLEFAFFISLIVELCFYYAKTPNEDPLSPDYCEKTFYGFVVTANNVLVALMVIWAFLYFLAGRRCMRRIAPV